MSSSCRPGSVQVVAVVPFALPVVVGADHDDRQIGLGGDRNRLSDRINQCRRVGADVQSAERVLTGRPPHSHFHVVRPTRLQVGGGDLLGLAHSEERTSDRPRPELSTTTEPSSDRIASATEADAELPGPEMSGVKVVRNLTEKPGDAELEAGSMGSVIHINRLDVRRRRDIGCSAGRLGTIGISEHVDREGRAQRRRQRRQALVGRAAGSMSDLDADARPSRVDNASSGCDRWVARHVGAPAAFGLPARRVGTDDGDTTQSPSKRSGSNGPPVRRPRCATAPCPRHRRGARGLGPRAGHASAQGPARRLRTRRDGASSTARCGAARRTSAAVTLPSSTASRSLRPRCSVGPGISRSRPAITPSAVE